MSEKSNTSDWKIEMIIRLLEIIKQYESAETSTTDGNKPANSDQELAFLNHKIFGDPYPTKK